MKKHQWNVSLYTIKKCFRVLRLRRKNIQESDLHNIITAVVEELHSCGHNLSYRALWYKLKTKYNLIVKRTTVYRMLQIADPEGIANRFENKLKRRQYLNPGPNFTWHIDGYNKLKQFGFAIHGCIDGFSRYVLWLEVATTNNNPKMTAYYFLKTVKKLKLLPTTMRSDKGTENTLIESLQVCLRLKHNDKYAGKKSFFQGKSVRNQRIESFWSQMRKHSMDFYIQLFKSMQEKNLFDGSKLHVKCMQYCFGPLIKRDLTAKQKLWNEHKIRKQATRNNLGAWQSIFNVQFTRKI